MRDVSKMKLSEGVYVNRLGSRSAGVKVGDVFVSYLMMMEQSIRLW